MKTIPIILVILLVMMPGISFAQGSTQITLLTNKQSYTAGDIITISGTISSLGTSNTAVLQVYNPFNVLLQIGTVNLAPDGTFHDTIKAQGQSWNNDGSYQIKVIYISTPVLATATANIDFKATRTTSTQSTQTTAQNNAQTISSNNLTIDEQIKQRIALANNLKQQIDRGNETEIPFWVKDTARRWHDDTITNEDFSKNIRYFISSGLVKVDNQVKPTDIFEHIPSWQKKVAGWWSQGTISDYDYVNSIQFLLDENVIRP